MAAAAYPSVSPLIARVRAVNKRPISTPIPWMVKDCTAGYFASEKSAQPFLDAGVMKERTGGDKGPRAFEIPSERFASADERTLAVDKVLTGLREAGKLTGWRDEKYPVLSEWGGPVMLLVERAAAPMLGIKAYGVHMNGYTRNEKTGEIEQLWIAKRSKTKQTWPGKLDHLVAGGQRHGISPMANMVKECEEEAGIPAVIAAKAMPCGAVSYQGVQDDGSIKRDVLFVYDLELPREFVPQNVDGEVECFEQWSIPEVLNELMGDEDNFKPNVALVIIDFLVRNGILKPEHEGYLRLVSSLRPEGTCL